jgi:hypothetical protein
LAAKTKLTNFGQLQTYLDADANVTFDSDLLFTGAGVCKHIDLNSDFPNWLILGRMICKGDSIKLMNL